MSAQNKRLLWTMIGGIAASTVFVGLVVAALVYFDLQDKVIDFLNGLEDMGAWAPVTFMLVMALVALLLLPGVLLTTGAGFVFGVTVGTATVVIGTTLGATIAFLIARRTFGSRAKEYVVNHPKLSGLNAELPPHAWKIIFLTRLIPFFPSKLSNYFFGLTSVDLRAFVLGSLLGFIPLSLHNVYLGAIAAELTTEGLRTADFGEMEWAVYLGGFLLVIVSVLYLARWAMRALRQENPEMEQGVADTGSGS
jgi:uncharacterized membrane protein YdjX (TVP38/TMEM64 family)